jgi:DnaJ-class molecular chaperone
MNTEKYDNINPSHYKSYSIEVIDMMTAIFGTEATVKFCEMNAFKYRMRAGTKPGNSVVQDLKKESWYLSKSKELKSEH